MTIIKKSYLGFLLLLVLMTLHSFSEKIETKIYRPEANWDNSVKYERFVCTFNHTYISTDVFDEIEKTIINELRPIFNSSEYKPYLNCCVYNKMAIVSSKKQTEDCNLIGVDDNYLRFFTLNSINGHFVTETNQSGVVLNQEASWYYFGSYESIGQQITVDNKTYTIIGIVDDGMTQNNVYISYIIAEENDSSVYNTALYSLLPNIYDEYASELLNRSVNNYIDVDKVINISKWYSISYIKNTISKNVLYTSNDIPIQLAYEYENSKKMLLVKVLLIVVVICIFVYLIITFSKLLHRLKCKCVKRKSNS